MILCSRTKPLALAGTDLVALQSGEGVGVAAVFRTYICPLIATSVIVVALGAGVRALLIRCVKG